MQQRVGAIGGWAALLACLAIVAFIGLSRHHDGPSAPPAQAGTFDARGTTAVDRAESVDVRREILSMTAPVAVAPLVRRLVVSDDNLTVIIDADAYGALAPGDQDRIFADVSDVWMRDYKVHHNGTLDHSLTIDFVDPANAIVHHNMLYPQ